METINKEKLYFGTEAQKLIGVKSRQYIPKYVKEGMLRAVTVKGTKNGSVRYLIKGQWIQDFIDMKEKGLVDKGKYTKAVMKQTLNDTLGYCFKNKIETVSELVEHVKKLK